jgi:hypothetical protein
MILRKAGDILALPIRYIVTLQLPAPAKIRHHALRQSGLTTTIHQLPPNDVNVL